MQTIYDLTLTQLEEFVLQAGQKKYRAKQLFTWLYRKRVLDFEQMSDLPLDFIKKLKETFMIMPVKELTRQISHDGTRKYLFALADGSSVETVLMHFNFGESLCVTSQLGCNMGCSFCASGLLKKQRDLSQGEIIGQLMYVQKELDLENLRISNVVVMGTGEPFDNYDNVLGFCANINNDNGLGIGARHITISTCGIVPKIREFAKGHYQYNLDISLHATNNELRSRLMPINHRYSLAELMAALKEYSISNNRRITFEYILLHGLNDLDKYAIELANLIRGMNAYVNLIPYNKVDEKGYESTNEKSALHFYDLLMKNGVKATLRQKHGDDIDAACGQLRAKHEKGKVKL